MLKDILDRTLKVGDLVVFSNARITGKNKLSYGVVISESELYLGGTKISKAPKDCYLIHSLDESERNIVSDLNKEYLNLIQSQREDLLKARAIKQEIGGVYLTKKEQKYLYLGQYAVSQSLNDLYYNVNDSGYAYIDINDTDISNFKNNPIDINELIIRKSSYKDKGYTCIRNGGYSGYFDTIHIRKSKILPVEEMFRFSICGYINDNKDFNFMSYLQKNNIQYRFVDKRMSTKLDFDDFTFTYIGRN